MRFLVGLVGMLCLVILCSGCPETPQCTLNCKGTETCVIFTNKNGDKRPECITVFSQLTIEEPSPGTVTAGNPIQVRARLQLDPKYAKALKLLDQTFSQDEQHESDFPEQLSFKATQEGHEVSTFTSTAQNPNGAYEATWTPPEQDGPVELTVQLPTGELSASVTVTVDRSPPVFTVTVPPFDAGVSDGGTTYGDSLPGNLWRRDQEVPIEVRANESRLDTNNLNLWVRGLDGGPSLPDGGFLQEKIDDRTSAGGCDAGFCGLARVKLWEPMFNAFRGELPIEVKGSDLAGNAGVLSPSSDKSIGVTRWKWSFDAAGPIKASPAVGEQGVVYVGTASTSGRVYAIRPDGTTKWAVPVEAVEGSPTVGTFTNNTELVYVASNSASGTMIRAINGANGLVLPSACNYGASGSILPKVISAAALTKTDLGNSQVETGLFVVSGNFKDVVGMRPTSEGATTLSCVVSDTKQRMANATPNSGFVATDDGFFVYPTDTQHLVKYHFGDSSSLWDAIANEGSQAQQITGLALLGDKIVGSGGNSASSGGLYQIEFTAPTTVTLSPLGGTGQSLINQFIASGEGLLYYGRETLTSTTNTQLAVYNLKDRSEAASITGTGALLAAPVLGADKRLYTINSGGELVAWTSTPNLVKQWFLPGLETLATASPSPTLDCLRTPEGVPAEAGLPGVLYVAAGNKLHAFVVDSPSMSKSGWPKYQHDARNTGNPSAPVTNCP